MTLIYGVNYAQPEGNCPNPRIDKVIRTFSPSFHRHKATDRTNLPDLYRAVAEFFQDHIVLISCSRNFHHYYVTGVPPECHRSANLKI